MTEGTNSKNTDYSTCSEKKTFVLCGEFVIQFLESPYRVTHHMGQDIGKYVPTCASENIAYKSNLTLSHM